jgi:RNA polymerase sigma-70 factor (ECF subfamily)
MRRHNRGFEALVRASSDALYCYAYWLTRDAGRAEELTEKTLLSAAADRQAQANSRALECWLLARLRREYLSSGESPEPAPGTVPGSNVAMLPQRPGSLDRKGVHRRLLALADEYREALVLQVLFGLPLDDIAVILEAPLNTVHDRLFRGRRELLRAFAPVPELRAGGLR